MQVYFGERKNEEKNIDDSLNALEVAKNLASL